MQRYEDDDYTMMILQNKQQYDWDETNNIESQIKRCYDMKAFRFHINSEYREIISVDLFIPTKEKISSRSICKIRNIYSL